MSERLYQMPFAKIYDLYLQKISRKGRTQAELDQVITWLTGYSDQDLATQLTKAVSVREFFDQVSQLNPKASLITGVICGVRIEAISDCLMKQIRYLDKLVDDLAKGKEMNKILK